MKQTRLKHLPEDERREAQYDPRNQRSSAPQRMALSFWFIVLIFLALGLTAIWIMNRAHFAPW
jgi:hypothetical protein